MKRQTLAIIPFVASLDEWRRQGGQLANVGTFFPFYEHRYFGPSVLRKRATGRMGVQCRRYFSGVG